MSINTGDTLYYIDKAEIISVEVKKVGTKYFYTNPLSLYPFDRTTLKYTNKDYSQHNKQLYINKQDALDYLESERLKSSITSYFYHYGVRNLNIEQMRYIDKIINQKHEKAIQNTTPLLDFKKEGA